MGPTTIAFIVLNSFFGYSNSVYSAPDCNWGSSNLAGYHAVAVVGYGKDPRLGDYWICRNSWGYWWGDQGYFRIARNKKNMCDLALNAIYPIV